MSFWSYVLFSILAGAILFVALYVYLRMLRHWRSQIVYRNEVEWTWDGLHQAVKDTFLAWTSDLPLDMYREEEEFSREMKRRVSLRKSLRSCCSGDIADKEYIKEWIVDMLREQIRLTKSNADQLLPIERPEQLTSQDKFDLLLFVYKKRHGLDALSRLIEKYGWDERKRMLSAQGEYQLHDVITSEDIDTSFRLERLQFSWEDRIRIIAQRLYQLYKGFSVIDEIRDMRIDGVSGGVSGIPDEAMTKGDYWSNPSRASFAKNEGEPAVGVMQRACDSIWIFYKGKSIRLAFLTFGTESELRRVCHNIYKYQTPGSLTEADGYRINHMKDGSRVVVLRPPFAESWSFFVRKFDTQVVSLDQLIRDKNAELPIKLLHFLMRGARITAITGAQGSGKTTLLMALIQSIYAFYPLRVQEQAFELNLRKIYPGRNILTLRETERIAGQAGLDVQKKTDGTVHILGEVATDPVAAWMIQMSQVASLFTVFTHHAKTFPDLVLSLRNSLLKTGMFHNESIAEQQVCQVIHFDVHLARDVEGNRYIERITECIPINNADESDLNDEKPLIPNITWDSYIDSAQRMHRYIMRTRSFTHRNIIEYHHGRYYLVNPISVNQKEAMEAEMTTEDKLRFREWLAQEGGYSVAS
ncbi:Flp pilus assembly complex ATPase component TadA [Paenibacillus alvei]|uniref:Flp pilus assembly complex ATPase component TadA n=1 Tax=Paenibacillus alvei TaxID=44250 RepID=A0ABT4H6A3_PAEAL|nr:ATPase, T2SS/T4P/T4SS family [Paenibacillus alvei]MCY7487616.1 Flp pilus assembly complex ATPase component TadA [Paenibacillus alvei]MCY9764429.1 Flp pilus assembly complex ATPase component TadA [Paenibacillus alvei]MCY9767439.1 Flp pilus assembly complex ATPase component TadA [Paenibacillus alvei]